MRMRIWLVLLSVALLWVSGARMVHAGNNVWTSLGPEGAIVNALALDPSTPTTLYAGTATGGVFKSTSGGSRWSAVNTGLPRNVYDDTLIVYVTALAIDPSTPTTLY